MNRPRTSRSLRARLLALVCVLAPLIAAGLAAADKGQWTPSRDWSRGNTQRYAVHMMLLPGSDNLYHSRILWFEGQVGDTMQGAEWGWRPI